MLTEAKMRALTKGLPSKSAKMRALAKEGVPRADIARFLGTNYAFVRNVLGADTAKATGLAEQPQAEYQPPGVPMGWRLRMANGVVAIPAEALVAIGFTGENDVIMMEVADQRALRVWSLDEAVRYAQEITRPLRRPGHSVVDELLAERRREFEGEEEKYRERRTRLGR